MPTPTPTQSQLRYHHNMIKGRIAETLVQEMFLSLGFEVYHYGMEHTVPGITGKLNRYNDAVSILIRNTPDFVIKEPETGKVMLVEVKFRASGRFDINELPKQYGYPDAWFIIVSKKNIKCLRYTELQEGRCTGPDCDNHLAHRKEFNLDPERVRQFCEFAVQFFAAV